MSARARIIGNCARRPWRPAAAGDLSRDVSSAILSLPIFGSYARRHRGENIVRCPPSGERAKFLFSREDKSRSCPDADFCWRVSFSPLPLVRWRHLRARFFRTRLRVLSRTRLAARGDVRRAHWPSAVLRRVRATKVNAPSESGWGDSEFRSP